MKIVLEHISKQYKGKYVLKDFTTELTEGVYGLLGANGAGKTTLINIFVGILGSSGGTVRIDGQDARALGRDFLSKIGYMPQYPVFYRDFTVMDFLLYMCALKGIPAIEGKKRALELLGIVNLLDAKEKRIGALSGGMRQRVGIVQAMLGDPEILILDEPTAGLDPSERIRFRNLISQFAQGRTILLATHIVSDVECIAKEIIILKEGVLITQGTTDTLEQNIYGKVWEVTADRAATLRLGSQYDVSNMKQQGERFLVRIVSGRPPAPEAAAVSPNLEDVFLYYFGVKHDSPNQI
ncbi:MAG: ABC transporter ATP-binding protein [Lachnospiraceae bacterium]|jgi:ABC-2 type transport system ATP-binding protein|nr:ABC transporter ATP-binding protein [Lachnospiraceae bacterium]